MEVRRKGEIPGVLEVVHHHLQRVSKRISWDHPEGPLKSAEQFRGVFERDAMTDKKKKKTGYKI